MLKKLLMPFLALLVSGCGLPLPNVLTLGAEPCLGHVVTVDLSRLTSSEQTEAVSAMSLWNNDLGWQHFEGAEGQADIIAKEANLPDSWIGDFSHLPFQQAYLNISSAEEYDFGSNMVKIIFLHEFGHSLGLAHVNDRTSIMYPTYSVDQPSPTDVRRALQNLR